MRPQLKALVDHYLVRAHYAEQALEDRVDGGRSPCPVIRLPVKRRRRRAR